MKIIVVDIIPEFREIFNALKNKISKNYKISDKIEGKISLYINIDKNDKTNLSRVIFSSKNREYEKYFRNKFAGGETIINYSYLIKDYPTVGLELDYNYATSEKGVALISDLIIQSIYEHDKT